MNEDINDYARNWSGDHTIENNKDIANRVKNLLRGEKYTLVTTRTSMMAGNMTSVKVDQELKPHEFKIYSKGMKSAGFIANDTYGTWGYSTYNINRKNKELYDIPYFLFEKDRVVIIEKDGFGYILETHIVIQDK